MTGNTALDIFIGLVFVYLLYSLLAAVLLEIINTRMNIRGKNLKHIIYTMLNDDLEEIANSGSEKNKNPSLPSGWLKQLRHNASGKGFTQKTGGLARAFYYSNAIRYMGAKKRGKRRPPSNISASQFANGMVEILSKNAADQKQQIQTIQAVLNNKEDVENENRLSSSQASKNGLEYLKFLYVEAKGDLDKYKDKLEDWYEEMMPIATEWYKKRTQVWLFFIGIILAFTFNLNTLYITKILSLNNKARELMVQMASTYLENNDSLPQFGSMSQKELEKQHKKILEQANKASAVLGLSMELPEKVLVTSKPLGVAEFLKIKDTVRSYIQSDNGKYYTLKQPNELLYINVGDYLSYDCEKVIVKGDLLDFSKKKFFFCYQIFGYLITALALSLGAPFWFDMLNKLMQLRGAVSQKKNPVHKQETGINNQIIKG